MDILVNWLAQGILVVAATAAILKLVPRSRTQARYCCLCVAYLAVVGLPLVPQMIDAAPDTPMASSSAIVVGPAISVPGVWWTSSAIAIGLCLIWSVIYLIRFACAAWTVAQTRRRCRDCPRTVQARLLHWTRVRTTGRQTRVVLSDDVCTAAVLGVGSPVIALSPALVERLGDADLDRVVIHEWAHIQRRDDVARFVQQCVHVVAGWHPAVWWLRRQLDLEREVACDEIVVAITGDAREYATCLMALATVPNTRIPALAIVSGSSLRRRVVRVLAWQGLATPRWRAAAVSSAVALIAIALVVSRVQVVASSVTSGSDPAATSTPLAVGVARGLAWIPAPVAHSSSLAATSHTVPLRRFRAPQDPNSATHDNDTQLQRDQPVAVSPEVGASSGSEPAALQETPGPAVSHAAGEDPASTVSSNVERHGLAVVTNQTESAIEGGTPEQAESRPMTPWSALANTGVVVGRASQTAGVKTAGFFGRMGKSIARSF